MQPLVVFLILVPNSFLLLVVRPGAPFVASLLLVVRPGAPSSFLLLIAFGCNSLSALVQAIVRLQVLLDAQLGVKRQVLKSQQFLVATWGTLAVESGHPGEIAAPYPAAQEFPKLVQDPKAWPDGGSMWN